MDTLFAQLKKLYDNELYDQVQPVVSELISFLRFKSKNAGMKAHSTIN